MKSNSKHFLALVSVLLLTAAFSVAASAQENNQHNQNTLVRLNETQLLFERLRDVANIDIVRITGPSLAVLPEDTGCEFVDTLKANPLIFHSYVFFPKEVKQGRKYPLIVFPHGGIHASFSTGMTHVLRELLAQGYIVVAPDYRGSTGYGRGLYEAIDYGGLENDDVLAARDYMVENYSVVDPDRVGIMGWSHGGMITLMNLLNHPDKYACGYAGVPVSDVAYRLGYQEKSYTKNFTQPYHVGATPQEDPEAYARRSPVTYAPLLSRPLMITTCVNDDDVSWTEVNRMIEALKAADKDFEYKIYPWQPGSHQFERLDSSSCSDIRFDTYKFLARYLKPAHPFRNVNELRKAGYMYY